MKLQESLSTFEALDTTIWVVSTDEASKLQALSREHDITFPRLMDPDLEVIERYGLQRPRGKIPHPATMVIDKDGVIRYLRVDVKFRKRPRPDALIEVLEGLEATKAG